MTASGRPPCDPEIYEHGQPVALLSASDAAIEQWVRCVASLAKARLDWHYNGGFARVLHLGDEESRARVEDAVTQLQDALDGSIVDRYRPEHKE